MNEKRLHMANRRRFMQLLAATVGGASLTAMRNLDPPGACPVLPRNGIPFKAGDDARPIVARKPISAYSSTELLELRGAFAALRALPENDPRSWISQADLHAAYCRQCGNSMLQVHGSWSFLPWHRAYLYYYERILGSLVGNPNGFRLPYWEWEINREIPRAYVTPANRSNALWDAVRNAELIVGNPLPAGDAQADRVRFLNDITDFATFGGSREIGGACEIDPHNVIHSDLGQQEPPWHDMGNLGFSARDPLFFGHHTNVDKLWSRWNDGAHMAGMPSNAYQNPDDASFLALRWSFYDENGRVVSISAADVLDHENHLRYAYPPSTEETHRTPFRVSLPCELVCCAHSGTLLATSEKVRHDVLNAARKGNRVALVLPKVVIPNGFAGTFNVIAFHAGKQQAFGRAVIADDGMLMRGSRHSVLAFEVTDVIEELLASSNPASLYALSPYGGAPFVLQTQGAQLRVNA